MQFNKLDDIGALCRDLPKGNLHVAESAAARSTSSSVPTTKSRATVRAGTNENVTGTPNTRWGEQVTALVKLRPGESATDEELRDTVILLFQGGIDTTRNQLGLGIDLFIRHPDQWRLLGQHRIDPLEERVGEDSGGRQK